MLGKRERRGQDRKEGYRRREDYGGGVGLAIVAALEKKNAAVKIVTMTPAPPLMISFSSVGRLFFGVDEEEDEGPSRNVGLPFAHRRRGSSELPCTKTSDFLSSCFLCKKKLHGVDIYMYRYRNHHRHTLSLSLCLRIRI